MVLQPLDQRGCRGARRAVGPEFVPEARRPQPALRLIERIRVSGVGLDLLHQSGDVAGEAVVLDGDRGLAEMVAVLDPLRDEGRLVRVVVERRGGGVQVRQRRRIEHRLHACVALRDIDDVAMDVVDRTPDELPEIGSERQRARGRGIRVLDGSDLFIELIDDDLGVQIAEIVDLGNCRASASAARR